METQHKRSAFSGKLGFVLTKYADYMQKLNDVDTDNLSTADAAYYTKVQARIVKKLAEIQ